MFVDETGTTTRMARTHGWGRKGHKLIGRAPHGHWLTQTFVAGLAHDRILAPMLLPCPMTGDLFRQWLEEWLIPDMQLGSIVVLDNLAAHKVAGVRQCLEAAGMGLLYLPPYSPDFNPIENAFAKLKALLSKAAERTIAGLWRAIGKIVDLFSPTECANYFAAAGYDAD